MKTYKIILLSILVVAILIGGKNKTGNSVIQVEKEIQLDAQPGVCPFLTKDRIGNAVISWARALNDSTSIFCYAVSTDNGRSFGQPIEVPSSTNIQPHSENLPKIIFKPSGEIIALWGAANPNPKNKYSGLVFYSQSFNEGKTWTAARTLVDDSTSYDQRYYDVALLPNKEVAMIWLDNRKTSNKEGSGLYFAMTEGSKGFTNEKMISQNCCQCCRTDLFVDGQGGIHVLYRGIIQDSIRDMVHIVSLDESKTFSSPKRISNDNWVLKGCPHTGPAITENDKGLHFAWFTGGNDKGCFYTQSRNNGNDFAPRDRISTLGSHPQISATEDGNLLIAWDEPVEINKNHYKRIGLQKRNGSNNTTSQRFITSDSTVATYPVLATLKDHISLIAYSVKKADKNYVMFRRVNL